MKFVIMGGGIVFYKYLLMKHKKSNISATIHLTRKKFIYSGRYLKGGHFEKIIGQGGGTFILQTFKKHSIDHGNE